MQTRRWKNWGSRQMGKRLEKARMMKPYIQKAVQSLSDAEAVMLSGLYPKWSAEAEYAVGEKVQHMDKLYRCLQGHTAQTDWAPDMAASLWTVIDEARRGTFDDPILYSGNMVLEKGKYYTQDGFVYICTRDSINSVFAALSELVGIYMEPARSE